MLSTAVFLDNSSKKKRGRPKTNPISFESNNVINISDSGIVTDIKKKGRKPRGKIISYSNNQTDTDDSPIIVNIPLSNNDIDEIDKQFEDFFVSTKNEESDSVFSDCSTIDDNTINYDDTEIHTKEDLQIEKLISSKSIQSHHCTKCKQYKQKIIQYKNKINKLNELLQKYEILLPENNTNVEIKFEIKDLMNNHYNQNVVCWWCCHQFDNKPCFLPDKFYQDIFYVFGYFCSFNCAMAYNVNMNDYKMDERNTIINYMYYKMFNKHCVIKIAPPRESLSIFGGPFTIDQFRDNFNFINKDISFILPHIAPIVPLIEIKYKHIDNIIQSNELFNDTKLKRSKPIPMSNNII